MNYNLLNYSAISLSRITAIFSFALFTFGISSHAHADNSKSIKPVQIKIVYASEMTEINSETKGGYPQLASMLSELRQQETPVFFLFGGGSLGPSTLSSLDRGAHIIDLLNSLEPDAMGTTKREFSFFEDELSLRAYEAAFPIVSSNIHDPLTGKNLDGLLDYFMLQRKGIKMGLISTLNPVAIAEYNIQRIEIRPQLPAIRKSALALKDKGADLIVLLHSGYLSNLNQLLEENVIDLALQKAPSSQRSYEPENDTNTPSPPGRISLPVGQNSALVNISLEKNHSPSIKWNIHPLNEYSKDPDLLNQVMGYADSLNLLLDRPIGVNLTPFDTSRRSVRTQESAFGNMLTDAMRAFAKSDICMINGGTIRGETSYPANSQLSYRDISKELPFRNTLQVITVSGAQIRAALENGFSVLPKHKGRFPQVSGMTVEYQADAPSGKRVKSILIANQPLQESRQYTLATTNFQASGGDGYVMFRGAAKDQMAQRNSSTRLISDILIEYIRTKGRVAPKVEGRIVNHAQ